VLLVVLDDTALSVCGKHGTEVEDGMVVVIFLVVLGVFGLLLLILFIWFE